MSYDSDTAQTSTLRGRAGAESFGQVQKHRDRARPHSSCRVAVRTLPHGAPLQLVAT